MTAPLPLDGKIALVTGASRGIGRAAALALAKSGAHIVAIARTQGGLTAFLYSTQEDYIARAETAYARAGAQLTINLVGAMPLNFAAAYSDYHVTGLNPAGNATLTNLAFVASRFGIVQSRRPVTAPQEKAA